MDSRLLARPAAAAAAAAADLCWTRPPSLSSERSGGHGDANVERQGQTMRMRFLAEVLDQYKQDYAPMAAEDNNPPASVNFLLLMLQRKMTGQRLLMTHERLKNLIVISVTLSKKHRKKLIFHKVCSHSELAV